jgi:aspartate dehydrogenase
MPLKVAIAGLGAIGMRLARMLDEGMVPGMTLTAVSARDLPRAADRVAHLTAPPRVTPLAELPALADIVVECAPARVFREVAAPTIAAGRTFMPLSVGALLDHMDLVDEAARTGARIIVPTGALVGLDTVRAMAVGDITEIRLETRKPPAGLEGAPYLVENGINIANLTEPKRVFAGTAREAARAFPANVNVAAALGLAGLGPDHTRVEVWADPSVNRNHQTVTVKSDAGEAQMTIANIPSADNPRTGRVVAQSVAAALRRMTAPLVAGS